MLDDKKKTDAEIQLEETEIPDDIELEETEIREKTKIKKLQEKLKKCEVEKLQHLEDLQRAKADFLNARKRLEEENLRERKRASVRFVEELLPLCDSFHMAMSNEEVWQKADAVWRKGVESIFTQLQKVLHTHHVKTLNPIGEVFDPTMHDAISSVVVDNKKQHHTVMQVIQPGYTIDIDGNTEVIRPARVAVGEFKD